ncbi:Isoleucine--tRNA ligase [Sulfidibacter corallicola]|uniref:Isoleucine--tRNA ligase n=1 Tax=Sulfidibacter corallicola TaxID=2818388 RepID=A0A8A4TRL6_SULCO|nr:isoleucine--tRNA ligase [Sulfidibacter corallicola]QTD52190.1 isoleucine--tRNA ligase [Sulfidibacter corallicola]
MFEAVSPKTNFPELEEKILDFWQRNRIFEKSVENRAGAPEYVFFDGPPFATGLPHYGHLLAGTIKDIVPRYWTMHGYRVERRFGWDCHGLPVENEALKDLKELEGLSLSGKYDIEKYGVAKFNEYCRSIVLRYTKEWEIVVRRMGRWVDFENGYRTMDKSFMESIWWVFKQLWDKGLVYKGYRVMPFSWKLSTPLSNFEAKMNYQDVQDPAVTIKFRLKDSENTSFLAWTTTPWTLPSNLALAVGEDITYAEVRDAETGEHYILAEALVEAHEKLLKRGLEKVATHEARALVGREYLPPFDYFEAEREHKAFRVITSGHVTTKDGTGIVHMAPAFGEDDFWACKEAGLRLVDPVDVEGTFTDPVTDFKGMMVKDADRHIIRHLKESGKLLHQGTLQHSYPFCWRTNTPLIYKAIDTWFVSVEKIKDRLLNSNEQICWVPEAVGTKRFHNWLEEARDWNMSRNRYWGTPLPVWVDDAGETIAVGSAAELEELCGQKVDDLHSHFIDELTIERDGKTYRRIPEVFDCWFESGAMPYAQNHYPFENKEMVEEHFPADFIAEGLDQTRGWFYTLTVLSTALFDKPAFKNVVVNGLILAEDGSKMSKSKKNYPDPMVIIDEYGADCLRAYLINSPVVRAEPLKFSETGISQIYRGVVSPLWNAYSFFVTYANLDNYRPEGALTDSTHELDVWILSRFQSLVADVTRHMEHNLLYNVVPELQEFIDELTNWYIRRSRRRFWRADSDGDKQQAYNTLYYVLREFAKVMAPFQPFLCEAIYQNLTRLESDRIESVHLCDFPKPIEERINIEVEKDMALVRRIVDMGRSLRAAHNLKVRQPLGELSVVVPHEQDAVVEAMGDIIAEELNVKKILVLEDETSLVHYTARPNLKVLGPRLGKALKQLQGAIREMGHADIVALQENGSIELAGHELSVDDFLIDRNEREEMVVSTEGGLTIALDTHLTDELKLEADAREMVNRIQNLRKELDFNVEDRVRLKLDADWLATCLAQHGDYIQRETLAVSVNEEGFAPGTLHERDVNGKNLRIGIERV